MTASLRHLGRGDLFVLAKRGGAWQRPDGRTLLDLSGGPLVQTLVDLPPPPPDLFANVGPPGGVETPVRRELEEEVLRRAGDACGGVLWATSGSDAIESALWAVSEVDGWRDPRVWVVREGSYHGNTAFTRWLSTRGGAAVSADGPLGHRVVVREPWSTTVSAAREALAQQLDAAGDRPAVILLETVPTTGPVLWPGVEVYREVLALGRERNLPVILDEVASGVYRHGWFSAFDWCGADAPAAVALSKGLTCGAVPLSCVLLRRDVADALRALPRLPAFTFGLTDPAAWTAAECLRSFDRLGREGRFAARRERVRAAAARLEAGAPDLRAEVTDTTLRLGVPDRERADALRRRLLERDLVIYENACTVAGQKLACFFCCPPLDLPEAVETEAFVRFAEAAEP